MRDRRSTVMFDGVCARSPKNGAMRKPWVVHTGGHLCLLSALCRNFTPGQPLCVFENLSLGEKAKTRLVVGINGDATHTSFPFDETFNTVPEGVLNDAVAQCRARCW